MRNSEQASKVLDSWMLRLAGEKTEILSDFLASYGEQASWDDWQEFLKQRPGLEGFEWARSLDELSNG